MKFRIKELSDGRWTIAEGDKRIPGCPGWSNRKDAELALIDFNHQKATENWIEN